jgi:rubrerythrin
MKFVILILALFVSLSALKAANNKMNRAATDINTPTAKPANESATQLDDLLRGEQAAMKAYDQVLTDTKDQKVKMKLIAIRKDHETAMSKLSKYVAGKKDLLEDTEDSGAWGTFAKTWTKGGSIVGNTGALRALSQGEEHGIKEYKEALKDDSLSAELKQLIKTQMLPMQQKHIETLKTFM